MELQRRKNLRGRADSGEYNGSYPASGERSGIYGWFRQISLRVQDGYQSEIREIFVGVNTRSVGRSMFEEMVPGMLEDPLIKFALSMTISDLLMQDAQAKPMYLAVIDALNAANSKL